MDKTKALKLTLGLVAIAGTIASGSMLLNRPAAQEFRFVKVEFVADAARLAILQAFPAMQTQALAALDFKDMNALRKRVETEKQDLDRAAVRTEHEALMIFGVVFGSLVLSSLAGIVLIRDSLRSRRNTGAVAA